MVQYPVDPVAGVRSYNPATVRSYIPYDYEILSSFFENYHIIVTWIDCNFNFGLFDEETGHWTGAVGKVVISFQLNKE